MRKCRTGSLSKKKPIILIIIKVPGPKAARLFQYKSCALGHSTWKALKLDINDIMTSISGVTRIFRM